METSILYPVMSAPPSSDGLVHDRSISVWPSAVAVRPVGMPGLSAVAAAVTVTLSRSSESPDAPLLSRASTATMVSPTALAHRLRIPVLVLTMPERIPLVLNVKP